MQINENIFSPGSVSVISSICMTTRFCVVPTTRNGCCLPASTIIQIDLLKSRTRPGSCLHLHPLFLQLYRPHPRLLPQTYIQDILLTMEDIHHLTTQLLPQVLPLLNVGTSTLFLQYLQSSLSLNELLLLFRKKLAYCLQIIIQTHIQGIKFYNEI